MLNQRCMVGVALWVEPLVGLFVIRLGSSADVLDSLLLTTCLSWGNEWAKNKEKRGRGSWVKMKKGTGWILVGHLGFYHEVTPYVQYKHNCACHCDHSRVSVETTLVAGGWMHVFVLEPLWLCVAGAGGCLPPSDPAAHTLMTFNTAIQRTHTRSRNPACFSTPLTKRTLCAHSSILKLSLTSSYPLTPSRMSK